MTASDAAAHGELFVAFGPPANIADVGSSGSASISVSGIPPMSGSIGFTYDPAIVAATEILLPPRIGFVEGCSVSGNIGQGTVVVTFNCPAGPPRFLGTLAAIAFQG